MTDARVSPPRHYGLSVDERLAHYTPDRPKGGCWIWRGCRDRHGYGKLVVSGRDRLAHRLVFELHRGPIPAGLCVLHRCDNPSCCNPEHLFVGTSAENTADRHRKGRSARQQGEANGRSKLTEAQVRRIRKDTRRMAVIAAHYGVSHQTVSRIKRGLTWRHVEVGCDGE